MNKFGQVIKVGEPLPDASEDQVVWSNCVQIHRIAKNSTIRYEAEFVYPSRGDTGCDEVVRKCVVDAVGKLPR
jgi:hypothetical protein